MAVHTTLDPYTTCQGDASVPINYYDWFTFLEPYQKIFTITKYKTSAADIIFQVFTAGVAQKLVLWLHTACKRTVLGTQMTFNETTLVYFNGLNHVQNIQEYYVRIAVDLFGPFFLVTMIQVLSRLHLSALCSWRRCLDEFISYQCVTGQQ